MADYLVISNNIKPHAELEERMRAALYSAEKHGIAFGQVIDDRESQVKAANNWLPEYSVTETVNADCALIKQSVIDMFGAPDITAGNAEKVLKEYYERINQYGFSAVIAHRALYSASGDNTEKSTIPLVRFLPVLDDEYYPKKRILFECTNLPATRCGTMEVMIFAFKAFCRLFGDKYDVFMLTNRDAAKYHGLEDEYDNILYPDTISGVFHLGYTPVQMHSYESQLLLGKHCLKIVQQMLDIIMVRSYKQHNLSARANIDLGVWLSDGITFISSFSKEDYRAYYGSEYCAQNNKKYKVIYVAANITAPVKTEQQLPFEDYILIVGNTFRHKVIAETIDAIKDTKQNYIIVGAKKAGFVKKNIYGYKSGQLEENFMQSLYQNSKAVLFPSIYEGYGLPIVTGLICGKAVIVNDNTLNRELLERYSEYRDRFLFFKTFDEIAKLTETIPATAKQPLPATRSDTRDSWDRVATELEGFFTQVLSEPVSADRLRERAWVYGHIEDKSAPAQFRDYKMSQLMRFAFKENIKHRHPKLRRILKKLRGDKP